MRFRGRNPVRLVPGGALHRPAGAGAKQRGLGGLRRRVWIKRLGDLPVNDVNGHDRCCACVALLALDGFRLRALVFLGHSFRYRFR